MDKEINVMDRADVPSDKTIVPSVWAMRQKRDIDQGEVRLSFVKRQPTNIDLRLAQNQRFGIGVGSAIMSPLCCELLRQK